MGGACIKDRNKKSKVAPPPHQAGARALHREAGASAEGPVVRSDLKGTPFLRARRLLASLQGGCASIARWFRLGVELISPQRLAIHHGTLRWSARSTWSVGGGWRLTLRQNGAFAASVGISAGCQQGEGRSRPALPWPLQLPCTAQLRFDSAVRAPRAAAERARGCSSPRCVLQPGSAGRGAAPMLLRCCSCACANTKATLPFAPGRFLSPPHANSRVSMGAGTRSK